MNCYLFAMKNFNSSFFEIDAMNLDLLLDLINAEEKITDDTNKKIYIDEIL